MAMYLTPDRYLTMGFGDEAGDVDTVELRSMLHLASAMVDNYCAVPTLPQAYSFRGGTVTGEMRRWRIGNDRGSDFGQRRFYPSHTPLKSVQLFRIHVTNTQYVEIDPDELFINPFENYAEVVALAVTSIGVFGSGLIPNVGLASPVARVNYTYGYEFEVVDEVLEDTDATLYRAMNQFWLVDDTHPAVVKVDGVTKTLTTDYTLDTTEGTVIFTTAPAPGAVVQVSYWHTLPRAIATATGLVAHDLLGEADLDRRGMHGLASMTVEEISLRREYHPRASVGTQRLPLEVTTLLDPYTFITVR
jgi:hypothetical protein